jgi:magnesium transporter
MAHQRPKIDQYGDHYFLVFYDIDYAEAGHRVDEHELDLFLGKNYLVTVHTDPIEEIEEVAERFRRNTDAIERGVGVLLYTLLDTIVDHYFPVVERIGERIEELELLVEEHPGQAGTRDIFALKKELMHLRRAISPGRDVLAVLSRRELPLVSEAAGVYFRDVYDHTIRVTDTIDVHRDLLSGVLDSYHATSAHSLNKVVQVLASYSIILMSVTLVAGIYGMNFNPDISPLNMPELNARFGYVTTLAAMLALGLVLYGYFRRRGWL